MMIYRKRLQLSISEVLDKHNASVGPVIAANFGGYLSDFDYIGKIWFKKFLTLRSKVSNKNDFNPIFVALVKQDKDNETVLEGIFFYHFILYIGILFFNLVFPSLVTLGLTIALVIGITVHLNTFGTKNTKKILYLIEEWENPI